MTRKSKTTDFRKLTMDQISVDFHRKIHDLETSLLDTDDLLWEVNHKAYQNDPKILKKVQSDLKQNFGSVRQKVSDISKLMKNYIDSDVITEDVAVKFMKFMQKKRGGKHHKKKSGDLSLTEVLDFLDNQKKIRDMKKNETSVFKNAEMLNSFLLNKHFQFDSDESASPLYKANKNSFEKTVKHAIGLSNFISSFGRIISSKLLNSQDMGQIKATPRKTKDVPQKKSISFELYQIPTKGHQDLIPAQEAKTEKGNRKLKVGGKKPVKMDSGIERNQPKENTDLEDVDDMPTLKQIMAHHKRLVEKDEKRFSHKKISYKISPEERAQKQSQIKVDVQTPSILEDIDQKGVSHLRANEPTTQEDHLEPLHQDGSASQSGMSNETDQIDIDDEANTSQQHLQSGSSQQSHDSQGQMQSETNGSEFSDDDQFDHDHQVEHSHSSADLESETMKDEKVHMDKPLHVLDKEGVYDENDPVEIQEMDKEEARLKKLEAMGYPKVEKVDYEFQKPTNSYNLKAMSLTTSIKKFDGNPDALNAYKTLNQVMSQPIQEVKAQYQETKQEAHHTEASKVEMVDPEPSLNTARDIIVGDEMNHRRERRLNQNGGNSSRRRGMSPSYKPRSSRRRGMSPGYKPERRLNQTAANSFRQRGMSPGYQAQMYGGRFQGTNPSFYQYTPVPRNLKQMNLNVIPITPLKKHYSDKDMFKKRSFLPASELKPDLGVPRSLMQMVMPSKRQRKRNLREKTDELYANMLKMKF